MAAKKFAIVLVEGETEKHYSRISNQSMDIL